jgi:hypothetical protein
MTGVDSSVASRTYGRELPGRETQFPVQLLFITDNANGLAVSVVGVYRVCF